MSEEQLKKMNDQISAADKLLETVYRIITFMKLKECGLTGWVREYQKYKELFIKKEVERGIKITKVSDFGTPFDEPQEK